MKKWKITIEAEDKVEQEVDVTPTDVDEVVARNLDAQLQLKITNITVEEIKDVPS